MKLYYSPGAVSLAVHIALEESGIPYETERVAILDGEHEAPAFLRLNGRGRLPILGVGDEILRETIALLVFIASQRPEAKLLPALSTVEGARCLEWLCWIATTHHVNLMQFWRPHRIAPSISAPLDDIARHALQKFADGNQEIEEALAGPWFFGDQFTLVDALLMFCYRQGNRIGLPMATRHPSYAAWASRMLERPAVARVWQREGITLDGGFV